ncbi:uncharacterized protein LOC117648018 [Thrips palmi]|uniref:Uncharacterized protein LOC117648018 n=1 Tax=Thrips palmi TaxID=161013 RepID=A0A6P8Z7H4_THRPL|nr:uncharacterized protein LOC117648018 [Thrips palmi]
MLVAFAASFSAARRASASRVASACRGVPRYSSDSAHRRIKASAGAALEAPTRTSREPYRTVVLASTPRESTPPSAVAGACAGPDEGRVRAVLGLVLGLPLPSSSARVTVACDFQSISLALSAI